MIVNPYMDRERMVPFTGTRILQEDFGLIGSVIPDLKTPNRLWNIQTIYAPRVRSGIRCKLIDQKGFITFITQMDLEVLLGIGQPGTKCRWSGQTYSSPDDKDFYGMSCDDDDLLDDLFDRELILRGESETGILHPSSEIIRRVHIEHKVDVEDYFVLLWDADPETGISPDLRMHTLERRWARVERRRARWDEA